MSEVIDGMERTGILGSWIWKFSWIQWQQLPSSKPMGCATISMPIWCLSFDVSCTEFGRYGSVMCTVRQIILPISWLISSTHWLSVATRFSCLMLRLVCGVCSIISEANY
ncbi:hypothetical protein LINGRAHAP2_LOCUS5267 [Linum grandiflorum]